MGNNLNDNIEKLEKIVTQLIIKINETLKPSKIYMKKEKNLVLLLDKMSSIVVKLSKAKDPTINHEEDIQNEELNEEDIEILKAYLSKKHNLPIE